MTRSILPFSSTGSGRIPIRPCLTALAGGLARYFALFSVTGLGQDDDDEEFESCSQGAIALRNTCRHDTRDDLFEAWAICLNIADEVEREECLDEAEQELTEVRELCRDSFEARQDLCEELGEDPYVIDLDPANFITAPLAIAGCHHPLIKIIEIPAQWRVQ